MFIYVFVVIAVVVVLFSPSKINKSVMINKIEVRNLIKILHLQGLSAKVIHNEMNAVYRKKSPSYKMVIK